MQRVWLIVRPAHVFIRLVIGQEFTATTAVSWSIRRFIFGFGFAVVIVARQVRRVVRHRAEAIVHYYHRWQKALHEHRQFVKRLVYAQLQKNRYFRYGEYVYRLSIRHNRILSWGWKLALAGLICWLAGTQVPEFGRWARTDGQAVINGMRNWLPSHWARQLKPLGPEFWWRAGIIAAAVVLGLTSSVLLTIALFRRGRRLRAVRFLTRCKDLASQPLDNDLHRELIRILETQLDVLPYLHSHLTRGRRVLFTAGDGGLFAKPSIVTGLLYLSIFCPEPLVRDLLILANSKITLHLETALEQRRRQRTNDPAAVDLGLNRHIAELHESSQVIQYYLEQVEKAQGVRIDLEKLSRETASLRANYRRPEWVEEYVMSAS